MLRDAEILAEQRLSGGGAEADNYFGLDRGDFGIEPRACRRQISAALGFWWMRRFPRGSHLKCFTALVT